MKTEISDFIRPPSPRGVLVVVVVVGGGGGRVTENVSPAPRNMFLPGSSSKVCEVMLTNVNERGQCNDIPYSWLTNTTWIIRAFFLFCLKYPVVDPGFPRRGGGAPTSKVRAQTYHYIKIFPKTA